MHKINKKDMESGMKRIIRTKLLFFFFLAIMTGMVFGCGKKEKEFPRINDLEYTVLEESEVPAELLEKIKEKKAEPFDITYQSDGYIYIARGYGTQRTSGYSVRVLELYESSEGIVFSSELVGPKKDELVLQVETWPYIVIKLPDIGLEVICDDL